MDVICLYEVICIVVSSSFSGQLYVRALASSLCLSEISPILD